jgi:putative oxidoreductase
MHHLLGPYSDYALTLLRIVAGFLFLCHGAQKFGLIQDGRVMSSPNARAEVVQQGSPPNRPLRLDAEAASRGALATWSEQLRLPVGRTLIAGVIELFGGALMMVGLLTSSVAFVASGLMAFAYFLAHAPQGFYPLFNRGEPAVLFCFIWLFLATRPPGCFALDNVLFRSRRNEAPKPSRLPRPS